jgi:hypothetical protein
MVEGITSRAFINSNLACTPATTVNANIARVATIQATKAIVTTEFQSKIEQALTTPAGPQQYQYTLVEPAITVGAGTITRVKNAVRAISESAITISESLQKRAIYPTLSADTTTVGDSLTKVRSVLRNLPETTSIGESISKRVNRVRTISETSISVGDSLTVSKVANRTISETAISVSDSVAKIAHKVRQLTETSINIQEVLTHLHGDALTESPITVIESLQASRILSRVLHEFSFTTPTSFTATSFPNTIPITERLARTVTHRISQTVSITENLAGGRVVPRIISEIVQLQADTLRRSVTHRINEPTTTVVDLLVKTKRLNRTISEPAITVSDLLVPHRIFRRAINPPVSFTDQSFTTGVFESFNTPSEEVIIIDEQIEASILPPWQKVLIEPVIDVSELLQASKGTSKIMFDPPLDISDSLIAVKNPVIPSGTVPQQGGAGGRRRNRRYLSRFNRPLFQIPQPKEEEPPHEPIAFAYEIAESPIGIQDSISAVKIVKERLPPISVIASQPPPPQIIEIEKPIYVDRIVEKQIQPPPIIKAQDIIVSKPKPIKVDNENILVSTQAYSNKRKSKAAAAQLETLQELAILAELEALL